MIISQGTTNFNVSFSFLYNDPSINSNLLLSLNSNSFTISLILGRRAVGIQASVLELVNVILLLGQ